MGKEYVSLRINKKQIVVLSVIICLLCFTGAYFFIINESASIHQRKFIELKTIAQMKIERISEWQKSKISEVKLFSQDKLFLNSVSQLIKKSNDPNRIADLKKHIFEIKEQLFYSNIFIVSTEGKILVSSSGEDNTLDKITYQKIDEATKLREVVYTDLFFSPLHNKILYNFIAPIIDNKNVVIAVLVFQIDPSVYLYPLIQFWPTSSKSAETIICRREGDSVLFLNELRFHKSSPLNYRIPISMINVPAVHALLGNSGVFEGHDYRGVKVVSYAAPIPNTSWFMVVKVDHKEMFNDLFIRETGLFLIAGILILLFCGSLITYYNVSRKKIYKELFQKEKQLREYHEEFKTILFSVGDGVITTDISGRVKLINNTAVELTGWKEKHAVGKPIQEIFKIINEGSRKEVENPIKRVLKEGAIVGLANHTLLISKDGREIPISDSGAPIRNEKGEVEGTVLVFRDKTEEHIAEKAILLNESRFQKAEFISKFGYYEINFNSGNVVASKGTSKIYGLYGSNLTLALIQNTVLTEYRTKLDNALFAMIEKGEPYDEEFKIKNADTGEIVDVYSHADYDEKDGIMFGIIQDITERKKIQEELSISEQRYRLLFELSPEAIVVHSEGKLVFVNPAAAALFGVSSIDELIGRKIMDLVVEESKEVVIKRIKEQAGGHIVPKIEEKFLKEHHVKYYIYCYNQNAQQVAFLDKIYYAACLMHSQEAENVVQHTKKLLPR